MNFWSKRIKNNKEVAKVLNEDADKIKALKNGDLEIKGKTLERTLKAVEDEKINKAIRNNEIWKWYLKADFKKLRKEFGYKTQREVAKLVGCDVSAICRIEKGDREFTRVTPRLVKIYEFYTNDFNKKINNTDVPVVKETKDYNYTTDKLREKVNKNNRYIYQWYKKSDIRKLRKSLGYKTQKEVADLIGVSQSCYSDLELKNYTCVNKTMINAYNFYNDNKIEEKENTDEVYEWYKSISNFSEYRRNFGYSLNKFMSELGLSYDQVRTFERKEYRSATPVVIRAYNFYHNESKRLPKIEWENNTQDKPFGKSIEKTIVQNDVSQNDIYEAKIKRLNAIIETQNDTIERYKKIIDKLVQL